MSSGDRETNLPRVRDALVEHVESCSDCEGEALPLAELRTALRCETIGLDSAVLSQRVAAMIAPELARMAARAFRRRVALGVLLALIPLPAVLAYDAFVLRTIHAVLSFLLPEALVAYLVASMGLSILLLIATSYAAIPLLVHRQLTSRPSHA
jgi:hypothetical protein